MTMIVALHLKAFVLVAADMRETYLVNGEVVSVLSDEIQKLVEWSGGIATGNGYVPLLNDFKRKLSESHITSTDEIAEIARSCSHNLPASQSAWKQSTNWLFTYITDGPCGLTTRVAFIKSQSLEGVNVLEEGQSIIWANLPDYEEQLARLNGLLQPQVDLSDLESSLTYHLKILRDLFAYGASASVNKSVSKNFQCFFHAPEVSGFIPNT